jgi:hypothetical protein
MLTKKDGIFVMGMLAHSHTVFLSLFLSSMWPESVETFPTDAGKTEYEFLHSRKVARATPEQIHHQTT